MQISRHLNSPSERVDRSEGKKARELNKAMMEMHPEKKFESAITSQDSNLMIMQMFMKFMEKPEAQIQLLESQLEKESNTLQCNGSTNGRNCKKMSATPEVNNTGGEIFAEVCKRGIFSNI